MSNRPEARDALGTVVAWLSIISFVAYFLLSYSVTEYLGFMHANITKAVEIILG